MFSAQSWATVGRPDYVGMGARQNYVQQPQLLVQLEVTAVDGSRITVCSDGEWLHQYGPLLENDLLMGEAYDARLEMPGWDRSGYEPIGWLPVKRFQNAWANLVATNGPPMRRIAELKPVGEPQVKGDMIAYKLIFDLGQNMVGRVRFQGSAPAGSTVTLRFAEVLDEKGEVYTDNLRNARATDYYTFKGEGVEVWEPRFTFHGFRYVELSGLSGRGDA